MKHNEQMKRGNGWGEVRELLKKRKVLKHRQVRLPAGEILVWMLLEAEQSEAVMELLEKRYA